MSCDSTAHPKDGEGACGPGPRFCNKVRTAPLGDYLNVGRGALASDRHLDEFARLVASPDEDLDLGKSALLVATIEYPELDLRGELQVLDDLAAAAAPTVNKGEDALYRVNALSEYLFDEAGFRGNREEYGDPRNSWLNDVLERRLGIPITLSLVYMEVGGRLGIPLLGVGMPGHFLVRHEAEGDLFIDPFNGGVLLSPDECVERFREVTNGAVEWDAGYLAPVGGREIVTRVLRNLKLAYLRLEDHRRALAVIDWLLVAQPQATHELRDRGLLYFQTGRYAEALDDLRDYVDSGAGGPDGPAVQELIGRITRHLDG